MNWIKARELFKSTLIVFGSFLISILAFLLFDFTFGSKFNRYLERDLTLEEKPYLKFDHGWYELKKGFSGLDQYGPYIYKVATSQFGFRKNPSLPDSASNNEVVFLGDSFTYGVNGPWEDTFVGIFEGITKKKVINAGVGSYSPTPYLYQYKRVLEDRLMAQGHSVVVGIDISDIQDEAAVWYPGEHHPQKFASTEPPLSKGPSKFVAIRDSITNEFPLSLQIYDFIKRRNNQPQDFDQLFNEIVANPRSAFTWKNWNSLNATAFWDRDHGGYAPLGVEGGLQKIRSNILEINKLAKKNKARLYILIYPWPAQVVHRDIFDWSRFVKNLCIEAKCAGVIDLIPVIRKESTANQNWYKKYYLYRDFHFNYEGNRLLADRIVSQLKH